MASQIGVEYHYLIGSGDKPIEHHDPHLVEDNTTVIMEELIESLTIFFP